MRSAAGEQGQKEQGVPAREPGDEAAEHGTYGRARPDARREQAERRAPPSGRHRLGDGGEAEGRDRRRPGRLQDAPGDQQRQARRERADQRARGQKEEAEGEGAAEAVEVGDTPVERYADGEDEQIPRDDPPDLPLRRPVVPPDVRHHDVDEGLVEGHDQDSHHHDDEEQAGVPLPHPLPGGG